MFPELGAVRFLCFFWCNRDLIGVFACVWKMINKVCEKSNMLVVARHFGFIEDSQLPSLSPLNQLNLLKYRQYNSNAAVRSMRAEVC